MSVDGGALLPEDKLYDSIGATYASTRKADVRWERLILDALGDARSVLNVGAGTGSYEPVDRFVVALDPSLTMLAQRPPGAAPAVCGTAESVPFGEHSFDATMAILTVHHWSDWRRGIAEVRRVTRARIVILTAEVFNDDTTFWLVSEYFPEINALDRKTMPMVDALVDALPHARVSPLLVPADCTDGFLGAYWRRPEAYLDPVVRGGISGFFRIGSDAVERGIARLASDLANGEWDRKHGDLRSLPELDIGYRLVIGEVV